MIIKSIKVERVLTFLHDLSQHIIEKKKFSFTNKVTQYKLTWSTNAMCIRGILFGRNILSSASGSLNFTESAIEFKMHILANRVVELIDGEKTYLETLTNDMDYKTLDEKPVVYNDVVDLYKKGKVKYSAKLEDNNHSFPRIGKNDIVEGNHIDVACIICGAKKRKYKNGAICYFNAAGSITPYNVMPCIKKLIIKEETHPLPLPIAETTSTIMNDDCSKPVPEVVSLDDNDIHLKARLRECLVLIRVMYEDMIINGVNTNSKYMAGRFLYSNGYDVLVKEIENKQS